MRKIGFLYPMKQVLRSKLFFALLPLVVTLAVVLFGKGVVGFDGQARSQRVPAVQNDGIRASSGVEQQQRPPTLILIMLVKNEEAHLRRTLPLWSKVADFWVAGIDVNNTDSSETLFHTHLGHLPGKAIKVKFDGMGPSLSILVREGFESFPHATHGILADADFAPIVQSFNKQSLDVFCGFHSFTVWSQDTVARSARYIDWIYRNVEGAKVERRTHQSLSVPPVPRPDGHKCANLIPFEVTEQHGGYQDRSGNKSLTYIALLEADLVDMPNDDRTIFYLGHAHLDRWTEHQNEQWHLAKAKEYFHQRSVSLSGHFEQRYLAMLKAGEICARYTGDQECVENYWGHATKIDPARGDAWFYLGQHYRLQGNPFKALPYLATAVQLRAPFRSQAAWFAVYQCLAAKEFILAAAQLGAKGDWIEELVPMAWERASAQCQGQFANELAMASAWAKTTIKAAKKKQKAEKKSLSNLE